MKRQVVIIHGGSAYDSYAKYFKHLKQVELDMARLMARGWKDSFAQKLGRGYEVLQPKMPNPTNAKYAEWEVWFGKLVPHLRRGVVLVGHSLGGIFLVKYLATHTISQKVKSTVLIAAPFDRKGLDESLADFVLPKSLQKFARQGGRVFLYYSVNDPVVSPMHAQKYITSVPGATLQLFSHKGHFNQSTFPELVRDIRMLR